MPFPIKLVARKHEPRRKLKLFLPAGPVLHVMGRGCARLLPEYLHKFRSAPCVIVADRTVATLYGEKMSGLLAARDLEVEIIEIIGGEPAKSLKTVESLYEKFLKLNVRRGTPVIALGGGVVTDLVGFAAGTFMRGLPFVSVPTTLLAQADAALGGKTGVNLPAGKNLAGIYYYPLFVLIDPDFLLTLPERELTSGFAEIIKMAILEGENEVRLLEKAAESIDAYLYRAVRGKLKIVQADPAEKKERMLLNLGHTFAHAFETVTHYEALTHGEAVAIGLVGACFLSESVLRLSPKVTRRAEKLLSEYGLPTRYSGLEPEEIYEGMFADKKRKESLRFVLPRGFGDIEVVEGIPAKAVLDALDRLKERRSARR